MGVGGGMQLHTTSKIPLHVTKMPTLLLYWPGYIWKKGLIADLEISLIGQFSHAYSTFDKWFVCVLRVVHDATCGEDKSSLTTCINLTTQSGFMYNVSNPDRHQKPGNYDCNMFPMHNYSNNCH